MNLRLQRYTFIKKCAIPKKDEIHDTYLWGFNKYVTFNCSFHKLSMVRRKPTRTNLGGLFCMYFSWWAFPCTLPDGVVMQICNHDLSVVIYHFYPKKLHICSKSFSTFNLTFCAAVSFVSLFVLS